MRSFRGSLPFLMLAALCLCSSAWGQDGIALLHKMQAALGGARKIAAIRDRDEIQTATTWSPSGKLIGKVVKRTRWIRPNFLRLDQSGPGDSYVLYFDGTSGWEYCRPRVINP